MTCRTRWGAPAPKLLCTLAGRDDWPLTIGIVVAAVCFCALLLVWAHHHGRLPKGREAWRRWWRNLR